jgi:hypothetical protein
MASAFDLCTLAWGETEGYVVLSIRDQDKQSTEPGYWKDKPFKWPRDSAKVEAALIKAEKMSKDVYWAPGVYKVPRRDSKSINDLTTLWADLDEANPANIPDEYTPAAVWETSPGRWQALWILDNPVEPKVHSQLNKKMTYMTGADKGGWGLTKVLRVPGTRNHKYNDSSVTVQLRTFDAEEHISAPQMFQLLGEDLTRTDDSPVSKDLPNPDKVMKKHRRRISARAKQLMKARPSNAEKGMRSERLWELECLLAEAGLTKSEIVALAQRSVWNKFKGRHDEVEILFREAGKATTKVKSQESVTAVEDDEDESEDGVTISDEDEMAPLSWSRFDSDHAPIRWLVADIWGEGEVGFISGMPKSYKSWIALDFAVSVATGTRFLGSYQAKKQNVLLIQEEDPKLVMQDRLVRIAASKGLIWAKVKDDVLTMKYHLPDSLHIVSNGGFTITNEDNMELLEEWVNELKIGLVILDPLMMMAEGIDEFKAFDMMGKVLKPLKRLRSRTQASVAVVHHHIKGAQASAGPGGAAMYGSVALWAWEESALHLNTQGIGKVTAERFSKHANLSPIHIEMGDTDDRWDPEVNTGVGSTDLMDLITMYEDGITLEEVMQVTSLARDAAQRQLKKLVTDGKLSKGSAPSIPGQKGRRPSVWKVTD